MNSWFSGGPTLHTAEDIARLGPVLSLQRADDAASHPLSRCLVDLFERNHRNGTLPRRRDLPCRDTIGALPHLVMLEPVGGDMPDWRLRLVGQAVVTEFNGDPTGLCLSAVLKPTQLACIAERMHHITETPRVSVARGRIKRGEDKRQVIEIVSIPIFGADDISKWILAGVFFKDMS